MKKTRIIITMTCLMFCLTMSAQSFVIPPSPTPKTRTNTEGKKTTSPSPSLPEKTSKASDQGKKTREETWSAPQPDITTGRQVTGIERSSSIEELEIQASKGNPYAQNALGALYYSGKLGITVDKTKAASYFLQSAQQNHAPAQFNIAVCYYNGEGIKQDREKAHLWMEKAAKNNYADAKEFLENHSFE